MVFLFETPHKFSKRKTMTPLKMAKRYEKVMHKLLRWSPSWLIIWEMQI